MSLLIGQKVVFQITRRRKAGGRVQEKHPTIKCHGRVRVIVGENVVIKADGGGLHNRFLKDIVVQEVSA